MTTYFGQLMVGVSLRDSPFALVMETIAPGIVDMTESRRNPNQNWWETMQTLLPSLNMTAEQGEMINVQLQLARENKPPRIDPSIAEDVAQLAEDIRTAMETPTSQKPDFVKLVAYIGAGVTVLNWLL